MNAFAEAALASSMAPVNASELQRFILASANLLTDFARATNQRDQGMDNAHIAHHPMWRHRDLATAFRAGLESKDACAINREELSYVVGAYMEYPIAVPRFEVLLVDALVAAEVFEYGEEIKKNPSRYLKPLTLNAIDISMREMQWYRTSKGNFDEITWLVLKHRMKQGLAIFAALYLTPIVIGMIAVNLNWNGVAAVAFGILFLTVAYNAIAWLWRKFASLFRLPPKNPYAKALELHSAMVDAYRELQGEAQSSPTRIRERLAAVAEQGAAWHPSVFAILDRAIARQAGSWGASGVRA